MVIHALNFYQIQFFSNEDERGSQNKPFEI
jgi:hypothetical protein